MEKWRRWIDGPIQRNVLTMHLHRATWLTVGAMLEANPSLPESYWWEFIRDTYATTQAVAVRRQADTHRDVASLGKLIQEIRDDPERITREYWLSHYGDLSDPREQAVAERQWTDVYGGPSERLLDPAIPAQDFETLREAAADVKRYVDQHVAHTEQPPSVPVEVTLTLQDVHDDIDVIGDLFGKYYTLLTASSWAMLVPTIQHDWMAAFRVPWMPPGWRRPSDAP